MRYFFFNTCFMYLKLMPLNFAHYLSGVGGHNFILPGTVE